MRYITAPVLLTALTVLGGCTTTPLPSCELGREVPAGAVPGVRNQWDVATYPPTLPPDRTGCQRVWYGDRSQPKQMQVLATYYFEQGRVRRLVGTVPGGADYDCHYRDGALDVARSRNEAQCPPASEIERTR